MKIYYVVNAKFPTERAHGIQLAKMCEAFMAEGADLTLLLPRRKSLHESAQSFYGLRLDIPHIRLFCLDTYSLGKIGFLLGSFSFMVSYFFFLLWKRIRGEKYVMYTIDMDQFSFAFVPFIGRPYFAEIHDAKEKGFLFGQLFKYAKGIIVINNTIKEKISRNFNVPNEKIIVHPNGIDLGFFSVNENKATLIKKLGVPEGKRIVLYAGKFHGWKGMDILADVALCLPSGVLLCIVGETSEDFEKFTGKKIPATLRCFGHRDYKEIPLWFHIADALLVLGTSKNEYSYSHTSPMKLFEYMAAGRPIVASNTPAVRHIVSSKNVLFYEPDNALDFCSKVKQALEGGKNIEEKITASKALVANYTWGSRAISVLSFVNSRI